SATASDSNLSFRRPGGDLPTIGGLICCIRQIICAKASEAKDKKKRYGKMSVKPSHPLVLIFILDILSMNENRTTL
ncbi:MAG TPA: hypothetical protein DIT99_12780, partial [Candidatus Latescibacteria bacterium]|nr:hypothetical protein [Candidatus Latescibacterota bacterium]